MKRKINTVFCRFIQFKLNQKVGIELREFQLITALIPVTLININIDPLSDFTSNCPLNHNEFAHWSPQHLGDQNPAKPQPTSFPRYTPLHICQPG